jgi:hypothetical protein
MNGYTNLTLVMIILFITDLLINFVTMGLLSAIVTI